MLYIILCILLIIVLLPFAWSLAGFVYRRSASKLGIFRRTPPPLFYGLFAFGLTFYFVFFLTLLKTVSPLTEMSVRLLVGCTALCVTILFFIRLIPVYYAEDADVQSRARYKKSFAVEVVSILVFTAALETVSFNFSAYMVSGAVGVVLLGVRVYKVVALARGFKRGDGGGKGR